MVGWCENFFLIIFSFYFFFLWQIHLYHRREWTKRTKKALQNKSIFAMNILGCLSFWLCGLFWLLKSMQNGIKLKIYTLHTNIRNLCVRFSAKVSHIFFWIIFNHSLPSSSSVFSGGKNWKLKWKSLPYDKDNYRISFSLFRTQQDWQNQCYMTTKYPSD